MGRQGYDHEGQGQRVPVRDRARPDKAALPLRVARRSTSTRPGHPSISCSPGSHGARWQSLRFHAEPQGIDFVAAGSATGLVTRRAEDGRYAFVDIVVKLELGASSRNHPAKKLAALLAKAERDCFVGASLNPSPQYRWRVNAAEI